MRILNLGLFHFSICKGLTQLIPRVSKNLSSENIYINQGPQLTIEQETV